MATFTGFDPRTGMPSAREIEYPEELLPPPLQDENPRRILRLVNGEWTREPAMLRPQGTGSR